MFLNLNKVPDFYKKIKGFKYAYDKKIYKPIKDLAKNNIL